MASKTAGIGGLAERYARALFELAQEQNALDAVAGDLEALSRMLAESPDLARLVRSPIVSRAEQAKAIAALAASAQFSDLTRKFLGVLAAGRRLFALAATIAAFRRHLARHRGEIAAQVVSAAPLKAAQLDALKNALKAAMGRDVAIESNVDGSLIGGLVVRIGSRMIDASLRRKLQNLQIAMKGMG